MMNEHVRFALFVVITILLLITGILSSLMKAEKGSNENDWRIFLMVASWLGFGIIGGLTAYLACTQYGNTISLAMNKLKGKVSKVFDFIKQTDNRRLASIQSAGVEHKEELAGYNAEIEKHMSVIREKREKLKANIKEIDKLQKWIESSRDDSERRLTSDELSDLTLQIGDLRRENVQLENTINSEKNETEKWASQLEDVVKKIAKNSNKEEALQRKIEEKNNKTEGGQIWY